MRTTSISTFFVLGFGLILASYASAQIPPFERDALIALYSSTDGASWTDSAGWLGPPGTECTWFGVTCNAGETYVEMIYLDFNNLVGPLPPELGDLNQLDFLWLSANQIVGNLPDRLGDIPTLRWLVIAGNQLSGPIPNSFSNLVGLDYLDLNWNQIDGPLPPGLGGLPVLRDLRLAGNQLSGPIPPGLGGATALETLLLDSNQLSGEIPPDLMNLVNLNDGNGLDIRLNQLFTDDPTLKLFLDQKQNGGDWESFQFPTVRFDWTPVSPRVGETVQFNDYTTSFPISWSWEFGDGVSSTEQNPFYAYGADGIFTVTLTVSNSIGADSTFQQITVIPRVPVAMFSWEPTEPWVGELVQFRDSSTGNPSSWSWEFPDGTTSTERHPTHSFASAGSQTVTLTVSNASGSDQVAQQVTVRGEGPVADFTWQPGMPVAGEVVQFTDTSSGDPTSWLWDFNDGGTSSVQHPVHAFGAAGSYSVSLTVSNASGTDQVAQQVVCAEPPTPRDETEVSPGANEVSEHAASATDRAGNRVVVWQQAGGTAGELGGEAKSTADGAGIFGRYFDPNDSPVGDVIEVSPGVDVSSPTVSFDGSGNFVIGWQRGVDGIFGRYFDSDQAPLTATFQVDDDTGVDAEAPRVATAAAGDFVVAWRGSTGKQAGLGVFGRFFNPNGTPKGDSVPVDEGGVGAVSTPAVATDASGNAIVVWTEEGSAKQAGDGVFGRYFDPGGTPDGDAFQVSSESAGAAGDPSVGSDSAGDAVVVWAQDTGGADGWNVYGRLVDRDGETVGPQFQVNSETDGDQTCPSVAVNAAGDIAVAWEEGTEGISARFFTSGATPYGPQFEVAEAEGNLTPRSPEVSVAGDDTVTVSYTRVDASGVGRGVFLRSFDVSTGPSSCNDDATTGCLNAGRFEVTVSWRDFEDNTGLGQAVRLTDDTGYFWFFSQANVELVLKVLDGTAINGYYWVFYGALSNVEYTIVVTDTQTGNSVTYFNRSGAFASLGDTDALAGGAKAADPVHVYRDVPVEQWQGIARGAFVRGALRACSPGETNLCLTSNRFKVEAEWTDFEGNTGAGTAVPLTSDTGYFWFFDQANVELIVKVLDGRQINDHFWVFYGALSNVQYTITVSDTETGAVRTYTNPLGEFGSVGDTEAFNGPQ